MASSWLSRTGMGGAAWMLRNHNGTPLLHSRRAYSSVVSPLHADILSLHWAVESMRNLRQTRVIFEFSSVELRDALQSPSRYQEHHVLLENIHYLLSDIDSWCLRFASPSENTTARENVVSVTRDNISHSFVAAYGLRWLSTLMTMESVS